MWGTQGGIPVQPGMYGGVPVAAVSQPSAATQKHDIFVGNLAFNTTEEQLHQAFSEIGRVLNVRMVTDVETGKPRGFAFVEYEDPQAALSAIRNMNDYELNGRRLRVNFSNSSHLEALAGKLGMDLSQSTKRSSTQSAAETGTSAVADRLKSMSKGEMYDVVAKLKEIADRDPDEARRIISGHPQLPEALLFLMSKLEMIKSPLPSVAPVAAVPLPTAAPTAVRASDPRAAAASTAPAPAPPPRVDPRQQASAATPRVDPRQRVDPRAAAAAARAPPPPPQQQQPPPTYSGMPPTQAQPGGVAGLDPAFLQSVMSLTPAQIQQLPPDKQRHILQLRQQITGGTGM